MEILTITPEETATLLETTQITIFRGITVAPSAIGPEIVLTSALERWNGGENWFWCGERLFYVKSTHTLVGSGCFKNAPRNGTVEIGYGIAEEWQGYGYATVAVGLMLEEAFRYGEINTVTAESSITNHASARVLEKNGFLRCGQRRDPEDGWVDCWKKTI